MFILQHHQRIEIALLKVGRKGLTAAETWHLSFRSLHLSDVDGGDTISCIHQQIVTGINVPFSLAAWQHHISAAEHAQQRGTVAWRREALRYSLGVPKK